MDPGKATLEGMPMEIHLQILRSFLKSSTSLRPYPQDTYTGHVYGFGSLGILSVSKYFSKIGLSILYGENKFFFWKQEQDLEELDESKDYGNVEGPFPREHLEFVRWSNLRNQPKDQLARISGVDCLDLISQTQPGQERLKNISIDLTEYVMMLFMGGSLLQILTRLRGLKSLEMELQSEWDDLVPTAEIRKSSVLLKPERFGRDFLLLVKRDVGHIKAITITSNPWHKNTGHVIRWISHELTKRNKAWAPPPPAYMNFHRTISNMSLLHPQTIKNLADSAESYRPAKDQKSVSYLEDTYGVFP